MFGQGALIAIVVIIAFYMGNSVNAATASTMAFATLTLARLFHGFNCRTERSIFKAGFTSNIYSIGAFVLGVLLLSLVLFVPALHTLFSVENIGAYQILSILGLAVVPTVVIQIIKVIFEHNNKTKA